MYIDNLNLAAVLTQELYFTDPNSSFDQKKFDASELKSIMSLCSSSLYLSFLGKQSK